MDLKRFEEAKTLCESEKTQTLITQLNPEERYSYYFSYGNILGTLGRIAEMDQAMTIALTIAAEDLGDLHKCEATWKWLLHWGDLHHQWQYLLDQGKLAHQFGVDNGSYTLQQLAGEAAFFALRGLGQREAAQQGAEKILKRYQSAHSLEKVNEWQVLLQSVP